jgi:Fur family ferric uptake transcriptional regulator
MPASKTPVRTEESAWRDALRNARLRVTRIRLTILEVLAGAKRAADAQQIYDAVRAASRRTVPDRVTVYRTLNTLVDAGLAHKVDPGDRVFRFSLTDHARCTDDKHAHEHPHFVCDSCGTVECLADARVVVKPRKAKGEARPSARRHVKQERVVLHGTCEQCGPEIEGG